MSDDTYNHLETLISKLEKVGKLIITVFVFVLTGALWAARIEWRVNETESTTTSLKPRVEQHDRQISTLEGRLHGISVQIGKVPSKVAAKISDETCP